MDIETKLDTPEAMSAFGKAIADALRRDTAVVEKPVMPSVTGITKIAQAAALEKFEIDQERYASHLLTKSSLTADEQLTLAQGIAAWARSERR